jgi:predicted esterase
VTRPRGAAGDLVLGTWDVARESPDTLRQRLAARLAGVDTTTHPQAVAALRARLGNLVGTPNVEQSAQFLSDPASLGAALGREVDAIAAGRDPYAPSDARDLWRTIVGPGGRALPVRVIVPAGDRRVRRPLVIALHGAGGDENMFPDAYGAGEVVRQAAARGAIVVSPATTVFQRDVAMLDSVLAVMRRSHVIDTSRVYLLGHSMGAAATYAAAAARADRIAASVLLNGAGRAPSPGTRVPPSLWIAGALDPVIPVSRTRPAAEAAVAAGAAVTYREHPTAGHTLGVGPMLAEAFEFLFAHRLGTP